MADYDGALLACLHYLMPNLLGMTSQGDQPLELTSYFLPLARDPA